MRRWLRYLTGLVASAALAATAVHASGETCQLEMKKVGDGTRVVGAGGPLVESMFRYTSSQSFFMQIGGPEGRVMQPRQEGQPEFSTLIKKEPTYVTKHPFRGVVKLGSQHYGFAFDVEKPKEDAEKKDAEKKEDKKDEKKEASSSGAKTLAEAIGEALTGGTERKKPAAVVPFSRLYFDVNHNGDLTDDKVIEASSARNYAENYAQSMFPRVDLAIEIEGKKVDYAFTMRVFNQSSGDFGYANGMLSAAAYRQGEITLDGKKRLVAVIDFNSNGRFDDAATVDSKIQLSDGTVYPTIGDMLYLIDPDAKPNARSNPYDPTSTEGQHYVAKLVGLGNRFHKLTISPSGDTLSLEPSTEPIGHVTNPNKGYHAIVYGDLGFLKIAGDESGKAPLPQGQWRLLSYTFVQTEQDKPKEADKKDAAERSLMDALKNSLVGGARSAAGQPRITMVSARASRQAKPVAVTKDQTTELPFGPPYRPVVSVDYRQGKEQVSLGMTLVGSADEVVNSLVVNGGQPPAPTFTITTEDGKEVASGSFEYG